VDVPKRGMGLEALAENWRGAEYRLDKGVTDDAIGDEAVDGSCSCEGVSASRWAVNRGVTTGLREIALSTGAH
jgi:hypothetical protein